MLGEELAIRNMMNNMRRISLTKQRFEDCINMTERDERPYKDKASYILIVILE